MKDKQSMGDSMVEETVGTKDEVRYWLDLIKAMPLLSKKQECDLISKAQKGNVEARNRVLEANLKLVVHVAKKYKNKYYKMCFIDIISGGNLGLFSAIEKFDTTRGLRFSTYAAWWILQGIQREYAIGSCLIRLPDHVVEAVSKYKQEMVGQDEDAEELDEAEWKSRLARQGKTMSSEQYRAVLDYAGLKISSLYTQDEDGEDSCIDHNIDFSQESSVKSDLVYEDLLSKLNEVEKLVIGHLYGLSGYEKLSVVDLAKKMACRADYIEALKTNVLNKFRHLLCREDLVVDGQKQEKEQQVLFF